MNTAEDTIVAISSPPGRAMRGLIRISGNQTLDIIKPLTGQAAVVPRTLTPVRITLPSINADDEITLPALLGYFAGPNSYTGSDLAEIQLPGNPALLDRLLHHAVKLGGRLAEPGEFTYRAFVAGKLDLTQAEGVAATINAVSESQLAAAGLLRKGKLSSFSTRLADELANNLALVEAGIDFTDQEDVVPIAAGELSRHLERLRQELEQLLSRSRSWGTLEALPRVVLVGAPSSGKSTLFNALLGRTRAVIDALPGTTRDILEETLTLKDDRGLPVEVTLVDIAGLDRPEGALDGDIQAAARQAIETADLVLHAIAADQGTHQTADDLDDRVRPGTPLVHLLTKAELNNVNPTEFELAVSVHKATGLEELKQLVAKHVAMRAVSIASEMLALQPRHEQALKLAGESLDNAKRLVDEQVDPDGLEDVELVAMAMRQGLDELASLAGKMTPDDILGRVFGQFCVGK